MKKHYSPPMLTEWSTPDANGAHAALAKLFHSPDVEEYAAMCAAYDSADTPVDAAAAQEIIAQFLRRLNMPASLEVALLHANAALRPVRTVQRLATVQGVSRATLNRQWHAHGFSGALKEALDLIALIKTATTTPSETQTARLDARVRRRTASKFAMPQRTLTRDNVHRALSIAFLRHKEL